MFESIYKVLNADYDHEQPYIPMSKAFNREVRKYVRNQVKKYGYSVVTEKNCGYCESSGFVTDNNGHYVFFSVSDFRYWDWTKRVLIRIAKDEKDYRGENNHSCDLKDIGKEIDNLIKQKIAWENR